MIKNLPKAEYSKLPPAQAIIRLVSITGLGWAGAGLKKIYMEQVTQFETICDNEGFKLGDVLIFRKANRPVAFVGIVRKDIREKPRQVVLYDVFKAVRERCELEGLTTIELPFEDGIQEAAENVFNDFTGTIYLVN